MRSRGKHWPLDSCFGVAFQHNLFSLLLKTNFPVLQEGKEMGLIAVFSLE